MKDDRSRGETTSEARAKSSATEVDVFVRQTGARAETSVPAVNRRNHVAANSQIAAGREPFEIVTRDEVEGLVTSTDRHASLGWIRVQHPSAEQIQVWIEPEFVQNAGHPRAVDRHVVVEKGHDGAACRGGARVDRHRLAPAWLPQELDLERRTGEL